MVEKFMSAVKWKLKQQLALHVTLLREKGFHQQVFQQHLHGEGQAGTAFKAVLLGLLGVFLDLLGGVLVHLGLPVLVPFAECDEVVLEPRDGIAERPCLTLLRAAIAAGIVRGGMPFGAVGKELDQRRSGIGARAVRCPAFGGIAGERIVAIDA